MPTLSAIPDYIHESVRTLPVLPAAVTRLLSLSRDVDADFREIARIIETDQTLTARTLRAANSPLYSVSRRVKTVQQATVLLGRDTIVNLALGVSVMSMQSRLHENLPIDPEAFGRHSMAVALAARDLAHHYKLPNAGEAFVAGLLHDIGKLVLLMHFGETYSELMIRAQTGEAPLHQLEAEAFDLDHALVGHALCVHWNLPSTMAEAVAQHHGEQEPHTLADVVSYANDLVKMLEVGNGGNRFVSLHTENPLFLQPQNRDWMRRLALNLAHDTKKVEDSFKKMNASEEDDDPVYEAQQEQERHAIHTHVATPEWDEMLSAILWEMGYEPLQVSAAGNGDGAIASPMALFTDVPSFDMQRLAYNQQAVPVLDMAAWLSAYGFPKEGPLDVTLLRSWIHENLHQTDASAQDQAA